MMDDDDYEAPWWCGRKPFHTEHAHAETRCWEDTGRVEVWGVKVEAEFRGQGLGREIMLQTMRYAASLPEQVSQMWLMCQADNTVARSLYESLGFVERPFGCPGVIQMVCDRVTFQAISANRAEVAA